MKKTEPTNLNSWVFKSIAIDAPGHGKSDAFLSAEEYEMPRLVDWLHGLLSKTNVSDFFLHEEVF